MQANTKLLKKVKTATEIFDEYRDAIVTIIHFNVSDKSKADDIFQELFLSLVHKPVPSETKDIKGYLYRTIINDILDMVRRRKTYQAQIRRYAQQLKYGNSIIQKDPQHIVAEAEQIQRIFRLIEEQLPPHQAQAIIHRYRHNHTTTETARRMQIKKSTVSRYIYAGLKKIRRLLCQNNPAD